MAKWMTKAVSLFLATICFVKYGVPFESKNIAKYGLMFVSKVYDRIEIISATVVIRNSGLP